MKIANTSFKFSPKMAIKKKKNHYSLFQECRKIQLLDNMDVPKVSTETLRYHGAADLESSGCKVTENSLETSQGNESLMCTCFS